MQFKAASLDDLAVISRIFHSCWHISYKDLLKEKVRADMTLEAAADLWRPSLTEPQGRETVLGIFNDMPVSVFRIGPDKDIAGRGHLFSIYVSPDFAGKGLGSETLNEAIKRLTVKGFHEISLWVFEDNQRANGMYSKFGFKPTGQTRIDNRWQENEIELIKTQP